MTEYLARYQRKLIIPPKLEVGDTVAVVAPSSPPCSEYLDKGVAYLRHLKLNVVCGNNITKKCDYLAGADLERAADLNNAFLDPKVRGVFLARGGYGCMRILDRLDLGALARDPKVLWGMSDATAIQLFVYKELGLVTFSGPMVAGQLGYGLDPLSEESYVRSLFQPWRGVKGVEVDNGHINVLRPGIATGPLLGGCLSIVCGLLGTNYVPEFAGAILLVEDVNEPLYRVDRMFTQLRLAGIYDRINGMVLGHFMGPDDTDLSAEVEDLLIEMTQEFQFPIISRFPHGHKLPNLTIPHGIYATIDTSVPSLTFIS